MKEKEKNQQNRQMINQLMGKRVEQKGRKENQKEQNLIEKDTLFLKCYDLLIQSIPFVSS